MPLPQTEKIPALTPDHKRYFIEKLGLSERLMERCLGEALSAGGEFADLYFESVTSTSLGIDASLVKRFVFKERKALTFRVEAYNILNHADFANPAKGHHAHNVLPSG